MATAVADKPLVRLGLIVHNSRLVDARKDKGMTAPEFAEAVGISPGRLRLLETLRAIPTEEEVCRIAVELAQPTDYLFPDTLLRTVTTGVFARRKAELDEPYVERLAEAALPSLLGDGGIGEVEERVDAEIAGAVIEKALSTITPREAYVLRMRYGLGGKGEHTLAEVADKLEVTKERVRQIERKAMTRLNHPSRRRILKGEVIPPSPETPKTYKREAWLCRVCRERVRGHEKGRHILVAHPHLRIYKTRQMVRRIGAHWYEVTWYHCGFCCYASRSPDTTLNHVLEEHREEVM